MTVIFSTKNGYRIARQLVDEDDIRAFWIWLCVRRAMGLL